MLVEFYRDRDNNDIFAFFPTEHYFSARHPQYNSIFWCYTHNGQHGSCSIDYTKECKQVTNPNEYQSLLDELTNYIGYKDLEIRVLQRTYGMGSYGNAKYCINHTNGIDTNKDGSPMVHILISTNQKDHNKRLKKFIKLGYKLV